MGLLVGASDTVRVCHAGLRVLNEVKKAEGEMPGPRKKKIRLNPNAPEVEVTVMPFQTVLENFNEYLVEDGTVVNIKLVVTEVLKIDGAVDDEGNPVYVIRSTNVTSISAPETLRKPEDDDD